VVKLVEVYENSKGYVLREVYVNPKHVVSLREDSRLRGKLDEGKMPAELRGEHVFTKVTLDKGTTGLEIVVVGPPNIVESKLRFNGKELLNG
jgi:hypothetical protein